MVKTTLMTDSKCPLVSLTRIVLEMFTETAEKVVGHLAVGYWLSAVGLQRLTTLAIGYWLLAVGLQRLISSFLT